MNYLVMEVHAGYAVLLDEYGRFVKAANMNYQVGERVTDVFLLKDEQEPKKKTIPAWAYAITAMAACLVIMAAFLIKGFMSPYASVYISINPRVRIDVTKQDIVMNVEGVNEDGVDLLQGYDYFRKDLDLVLDELVDLAIDKGYLHEGGKITLTLDANDEWVVSHSEQISRQITQHLTDRYTITIDIGAGKDTVASTVDNTHHGESHKEHSKYNDTDYHDTDYGVSSQPAVTEVTPATPPADVPQTEGSHTDYYNEAPDGDTDYDDIDDDDGDTNYGDSDYDD